MVTPNEIRQVYKRAERLYSAEEVEAAVNKMAAEITEDLADENPIILCVMIGGVVPCGLLLARLDFPLQVDYVHATRYKGGIVDKELEWMVRPRLDMTNRTVLVVDDILDGGITLAEIIEDCKKQGAKAVKTAVLVEKDRERETGAIEKADYTGAVVENRYVFGYGMDYKRYLRNAPGIFAVAGEDE